MIVSIQQDQGKLLISYVKNDGNIGFTQFNIPPNQQFVYEYAQRNVGVPGIRSWDFKPVRKAPSRYLNKYRINEFLVEAGEQHTKHLFERNMPTFAAADIEVFVDDDGFPDAESARNRITAISFSCYPDITVFGSKPLSPEQINGIQKDIDKHLEPLGKKFNLIYKYHENEADLIYDFLYNYVRLAPLVSGWNFWGYDWQYITNRCNKLNLNINWLSPTGQWTKHKILDRNKTIYLPIPQHKLIVDYMAIYKKWDRTVEVKENDTLDFVAETVLGVKKIKYPGTLQELYEKDYQQFIFYSAIDSILVELIHENLKTMQTFLGLANITRVEAMHAFSPINMLEATLVRHAHKRGMVFPKDDEKRQQEAYEGAFVFDPKPDMHEWVASFDFASLYPSIMRQFMFSIENFKFKDKNHKPGPNEIKSSSGSVFDSSYVPLIPEILDDYYKQRKIAKKTMTVAEKEVEYLKKILEKRKKDSI